MFSREENVKKHDGTSARTTATHDVVDAFLLLIRDVDNADYQDSHVPFVYTHVRAYTHTYVEIRIRFYKSSKWTAIEYNRYTALLQRTERRHLIKYQVAYLVFSTYDYLVFPLFTAFCVSNLGPRGSSDSFSFPPANSFALNLVLFLGDALVRCFSLFFSLSVSVYLLFIELHISGFIVRVNLLFSPFASFVSILSRQTHLGRRYSVVRETKEFSKRSSKI